MDEVNKQYSGCRNLEYCSWFGQQQKMRAVVDDLFHSGFNFLLGRLKKVVWLISTKTSSKKASHFYCVFIVSICFCLSSANDRDSCGYFNYVK